MNKHLLLLLPVCLCVNIFGQTKRVTQQTVQLFEQRTIHLNSANASVFSPGKKSRVYIPVTVPPNTVEWYYSFSTSGNKSSIESLNLMIQLGGLIATRMTPAGAALSSTGITKAALSHIKIPYGSHAIDAYLCNRDDIDKFMRKSDNKGIPFQCLRDASTESTTQGIIRVNNITSGTWYIGLRNTSLTNAVDVIIEGVAIVEQEEPVLETKESSKGELYGKMGWKAFTKGDYNKCLELSQKAIQLNPTLAWVKLNIALTYLAQKKPEYLDSYIEAISFCKKSEHPKELLQEGLKDINDLKVKVKILQNADEIIDLINDELRRME